MILKVLLSLVWAAETRDLDGGYGRGLDMLHHSNRPSEVSYTRHILNKEFRKNKIDTPVLFQFCHKNIIISYGGCMTI